MNAKVASPSLDRASTLACLATAAAAILPLSTVLPRWVGGALLALLAIASIALWRSWTVGALIRIPLTLGMTAYLMVEFGVGFGGGFGRDTAGALLAIMLLLKLLELRSVRDGRAALSFSLFAILAAFLQDRGPMILIMALLATLLVVASLTRMAEVETPGHDASSKLELRSRLARVSTLAAYSLPLAVVAFFLFPRLASPLWALPQNSNEARTGLSDEMSPGDISSLFIDDSPIMRVRFDAETPPQSTLYWRGPVLSAFDGRQWSRMVRLRDIEQPRIEAIGAPIQYEVEQEPTERRYLFGLDLPMQPASGARLTYEQSLWAPQPLISVSRSRISSQPNVRFDPSMVKTLRSWFTELPEGFNPRTRTLIASWQAEGNDPQAIINRALALFNAEFSYTLNPLLLGRHSVDDFLFNTKAGYCEHFASAFAVMMRSADIPARVVTGYLGGSENRVGGYLVVRQSDAHAWTEVWLEDQGWVRIDPTSAVAPERINQGVDALGASGRASRGWGRPLFDAADWLRRGWNDVVLSFDADKQSRLLGPFGIDKAEWQQLAIALISAAGLALLITMGLLLRPGRDDRDALARAYGAFLRRLAKRGASKPPSEPPLAFASRIAADFPASADAIHSLSKRYAHARYAFHDDDSRKLAALCKDLYRFRLLRERKP